MAAGSLHAGVGGGGRAGMGSGGGGGSGEAMLLFGKVREGMQARCLTGMSQTCQMHHLLPMACLPKNT